MIETVQQQETERRATPHRRRVLRGAIVFYAENKITTRCMIRDMTPDGAQLKMLQDIPVPDKAVLFVENNEARISFEAVWRRGDLMGVRFDEPYLAADEQAIKDLEISVRTMRTSRLVRH